MAIKITTRASIECDFCPNAVDLPGIAYSGLHESVLYQLAHDDRRPEPPEGWSLIGGAYRCTDCVKLVLGFVTEGKRLLDHGREGSNPKAIAIPDEAAQYLNLDYDDIVQIELSHVGRGEYKTLTMVVRKRNES
jgi:hypothetical protein